MQQDIQPLRTFVAAVTEIMHDKLPEQVLLLRIRPLLEFLTSERNWLPDQFCRENTEGAQEYLLHCDPLQRFSVVCSVLAPGQMSPIQDSPVWGMISVIRGVGMRRMYSYVDYHLVARGTERVGEGAVMLVKSDFVDLYEIANVQTNAPYVSLGIFGGNIGILSRHRFDTATGQRKEFTSGYVNMVLPNLWPTAARVDAPIKPTTSLH